MKGNDMTRNIRGAVLLGTFLLFVPVVFAQTSAPDNDVQAAIRELRAGLKSLRTAVGDLKSELDATRAELRAARAANIAVPQSGTLLQEVPSVLPNAREVQMFLKDFPDVYPEGRVTGYYGDLTKKAIRKFQERYGGSTNDVRVKEFYELVFGRGLPAPIVVPAPLPTPLPLATSTVVFPVTTATTTVIATTSPSMQQVICPALPTVAACGSNEDRVASYSSAACGTYYTCVPRGTVIATSTATLATSTVGTAGWRRVAWGRGGSSLVGPNVPQAAIDARLADIAASCPAATQYDYINPSDSALPNAGVPSCPAGAATSTTAVASGGCARYGEGWHAMDASGTCFDPAMQNYRDVNGGTLSCASWSISGCSGSTSYAGDANSCPGFAYSRWDSQGKRYCQLNASRACDYTYPSYLTNGTNYKAESCPADDVSSGNTTAYVAFTPRFGEPSGGCGQYATQYRAMQWVIHGNAIGGSCVSGTRPSSVVTACPSGQWPTWDNNGWPTGCSGGGWTTATSTASTGTSSTGTSGTTSSGGGQTSTSNTSTSSSGSGSTSGTTYSGSCGTALAGLLGSGCHYMYSDSAGQPIYCNGEMSLSAKNGDAAVTQGCTGSSTSYASGSTPAGQKQQVWNSLGLQSWIRADADSARIAQLQQSCASTPSGANVWLSGAGNSASTDFGMPDPAKCASAAACTSGQYFNGTSCVPLGGSSPGAGSCSNALLGLLGTGCHYMYNDSSSRQVYCNSEMTLSAKEGDTATTAGCSSYSGGNASTSLLQSNQRQLAALLEAARSLLEVLQVPNLFER